MENISIYNSFQILLTIHVEFLPLFIRFSKEIFTILNTQNFLITIVILAICFVQLNLRFELMKNKNFSILN